MSVVLSEHLPLLASAPDGIQKLRGLILELAVRGKLVLQDPHEEPASELLKRIAQERAHLEAKGVVKKSKVAPLVDEYAQPFSLPEGWQWVRLATIGNIFNGNSINSNEKDSKFRRDDGLPYIATKDVGYGLTPLDYENGVRIPESELNFKMARAGAVFICAEGGSAGKKCGLCDRNVFFGNKLFANETFAGIPPRLVLYIYLSPFFREQFSAVMTGIIGGVSIAKFVDIPIPLPPLAEQHRIVAKVDELMALCDQLEAEQADAASAHARLVEILLGTLTQSTDAADLAANWQRLAEHFDTLFTTEVSIDALKQTVLQLGVQGLLTNLPNIPTVKLGDLLIDASYGTSQKSHAERADGAYPVLRIPNVVHEMIDLRDLKFSALEEKEIHKTRLLEGDIVVVRTNGSAELVGRCAVVRGLKEVSAFASYMIRLRFDPAIVDPEFAQGALRNHRLQNRMIDFARTTAGQYNVSIGRLRELEMPLPSLAEQHRIVAKVDELMVLCDRLKADIATAHRQQAMLADTLIESALEAA